MNQSKRAAAYCRGKPVPLPQALEYIGQAAQRGVPNRCRFPVQRRMTANRTGAKEFARHQRITARRDGFRPAAGRAGVGGGLGADGHRSENFGFKKY